jgi:hypothetical protein
MVRHRTSYGLPNPTAGGQRPPDLADRARRAAQGLRRSVGARVDEERDPFPEDGGAPSERGPTRRRPTFMSSCP